jgi:hypothetical protein
MSKIDRRGQVPSGEGYYWRMCPDSLYLHSDLEPIDIKVWLILCLCARDRGQCNPTNASLAETARCSVRTIKYSLSRLEDAGFVVGETRGPYRTIRLRPDGWGEKPRAFNLKAFAG